jgi:uncharacterized membrane protein YphA (DoxX/SURF4 family)
MLVKRIGMLAYSSMLVWGGLDQARHPASKLDPVRKTGLPAIEEVVKASGLSMIAASLALQIGPLRRLAAVVLAIQLAGVTLIGHRYWEHEEPQRRTQRIQFLKNLSMIGGALYIAADEW